MRQSLYALLVAIFAAVLSIQVALAEEYTVPILVNEQAFTLTVSVEGKTVSISTASPEVKIGAVALVKASDSITTTQDIQALKASAITIPYKELFRNNEQHIGKVVRYVGQVLQVQEKSCLFCDKPGYVLRIGVTKGALDIWDDPIWVDYAGSERFLEEDIVTVWGTVDGLETYTAVLGNTVTVPRIKTIDLVLGAQNNPTSTTSTAVQADPATKGPSVNKNANLRSGPGTNYSLVGQVKMGDQVNPIARNAEGSWFKLDSGAWIAAFLVQNPPELSNLPVDNSIPTPAPSTVTTPSTSGQTTAVSSGTTQPEFGVTKSCGHFEYKLYKLRRVKSVWLFNKEFIAQGEFLLVFVETRNTSSGTSYFAKSEPRLLMAAAGQRTVEVVASSQASGYAGWMYQSGDIYDDLNPGQVLGEVIAYDLPSDGEFNLTFDTEACTGQQIGLGLWSGVAKGHDNK